MGRGLGWVMVRLGLGLRSFLVWGVRLVEMGTLVCVVVMGFGGGRL